MGFFLTLLRSQLFTKLPYPTWSFEGQTVVITGSNTGLGLEAARHIVRLGAAKVILAVRTISKGEKAAENIIESTHVTKSVLEVWPLDLSDYESIKAFGARLQTLDRLDALIQNAGVLTNHFKKEKESGVESHIAINSVSAVLIGLLALPKLKETARKTGTRTRLTFVGSDLHFIAACKEAEHDGSLFDVLSDEKIADMSDRQVQDSTLFSHHLLTPVQVSSVKIIATLLRPRACCSQSVRLGLRRHY
ncbi:uncharacterized protein N0V89_001483 [Didymosphaeria variabile]|uniref:NAD(P)-binding protein n=1 Tax=Didymosphaeria variabile TaxID=1932322 RepID=A0A9W8XZG1_9PLEO|nr:uncharacterized protein N0V89_001483 [Didymosphaeria variabile]KAJ4360914.1 hypothetical protein N0V89_001483 [Didymosphaeria variabile]